MGLKFQEGCYIKKHGYKKERKNNDEKLDELFSKRKGTVKRGRI